MEPGCVIGIDFGTDSVRSLVIDTETGAILGASVFCYPRWKEGRYCAPDENRFRQHALDYVEGLEETIKAALQEAPAGTAGRVSGISVDTTGSTVVAVDRSGTPLCMNEELSDDPDAMFILWKDHTAIEEAAAINHAAAANEFEDYLKYVGGVYSSEWFWAKIIHVYRTNPRVRDRAFSWVEHCDWVSAFLTGKTDPLTLKRSRCAAGHKALWHPSFGGLPAESFLTSIEPLLAGLRKRLFSQTFTSDVPMGRLSSAWAKRLGLSSDVMVGVGAFDAHMGAVGGQIEPYALSKVMGTSTCDMLVAPASDIGDRLIKGICGQVDGSVLPGMIGMEAGQSAFGDIYAWFAEMLTWPQRGVGRGNENNEYEEIINRLASEAEKISISESAAVSVDWLNGRRTPFANQELTGALFGLRLSSSAPKIFRALVEGSAFGARKIVDCFTSQGVPIRSVIALGGVAKKSPFVVQTVADVFGLPIRVARADQTCALGAAMFASVACGIHPDLATAQQKMGAGFERTFEPDLQKTAIYEGLYEKYAKAGEFIENVFTGR